VSSEARWSDFNIEAQARRADGTVSVTGKARIEETGEVERVSFTATLVKEDGRWRVADWKY